MTAVAGFFQRVQLPRQCLAVSSPGASRKTVRFPPDHLARFASPSFGFDCRFHFPQRAESVCFRTHRVPFVGFGSVGSGGTADTPMRVAGSRCAPSRMLPSVLFLCFVVNPSASFRLNTSCPCGGETAESCSPSLPSSSSVLPEISRTRRKRPQVTLARI